MYFILSYLLKYTQIYENQFQKNMKNMNQSPGWGPIEPPKAVFLLTSSQLVKGWKQQLSLLNNIYNIK